MQNYFEYFSEIEQRFSQRRGSILLLSTLDWALIETWREAGVPLEAVLRGIDAAFDKHDAKSATAKSRMRKVNGLAWTAQAVMQAAEEMVETSTGLPVERTKTDDRESGFETERVATFLERNAEAITSSTTSSLLATTTDRLQKLAATMRSDTAMPLDELDRILTVLEERMVATVRNAATEAEIVTLREQADRELAPYRAKMSATQLKQVQAQFEQKRLLEARALPRLSLFYMGHE